MSGQLKSVVTHLSSSLITLYVNRKSKPIRLVNNKYLALFDKEHSSTIKICLDKLRRVVVIGHLGDISSEVLYRLLICKISVEFLDTKGNSKGLLETTENDNLYLYDAQDNFCKKLAALNVAKQVLLSKISNCREIIRRRLDDSNINWNMLKGYLVNARSQATLLGAEGYAAREYFSKWKDLVKGFGFDRRIKHPCVDPVNLLLSFGYTLVYNRCISALKAYGLNPRIGFFHAHRGKHCSLASDLMEQFRAFVDSCVLTLIRTGSILPKHFAFNLQKGKCEFVDDAYSIVFNAFEQMFSKVYPIYYGYTNNWQKIERSLNDMIDDTAQNYANFLLGKAQFITWRLKPCNDF